MDDLGYVEMSVQVHRKEETSKGHPVLSVPRATRLDSFQNSTDRDPVSAKKGKKILEIGSETDPSKMEHRNIGAHRAIAEKDP